MRTVTIPLLLSDDHLEELTAAAAKLGLSRTEWVSRSVVSRLSGTPFDETPASPADGKRKRRPSRCSGCRATGHNYSTCPKRLDLRKTGSGR